ncbi:hypothetical protein DFP72DRAFT_1173611 [Ephemerocybe angulata]|uniref:Uncharacterized protein n=1 Tax=Ephemerocybe angulata TaxID=980116 RepID=A0A8H6HLH0_9AGAR|nr:hypothetical protein DFP72DRAFT_1173611 [Tulosesus angulatus]
MWVLVAFYGIIDLHPVLPFYIELMSPSSASTAPSGTTTPSSSRSNHDIDGQCTSHIPVLDLLLIFPRPSPHRYFAECGKWDEAIDTFFNSDGDPTQLVSIAAATAGFDSHVVYADIPVPVSPAVNYPPGTVLGRDSILVWTHDGG